MAELVPHPFLDLDDPDRSHWLASFFDTSSAAESAYGVDFPILRVDEDPSTWLSDQYLSLPDRRDLQNLIRRSVVELIETEARREDLTDRAQVLGLLLNVVNRCGFLEIAEILRGWIRTDLYHDSSYRRRGERTPIRRTVWSILIGWRQTESLLGYLKRDLPLPELGSAALCFRELGRLSPGDAIRYIPDVITWPPAYWPEILGGFLSEVGAVEAIATAYSDSWKACVAGILESPNRAAALLAPLRDGVCGTLTRLFADNGIELRLVGESFELGLTSAKYRSAPISGPIPESWKKAANAAIVANFQSDYAPPGSPVSSR
jgi:hypothetical protein